MSAASEQAIYDRLEYLDEVDGTVWHVAWLLDALGAESLPPDDVDELRDGAVELAFAMFDALDILDGIDTTGVDVDTPERAADLLRELADQRASAQEVSRLRQDGRELVTSLLHISEDLDTVRHELYAELDDDENDEAGDS